MTRTNNKQALGIFSSRQQAENALSELRDRCGVRHESVIYQCLDCCF
jgi:hypothetical protein